MTGNPMVICAMLVGVSVVAGLIVAYEIREKTLFRSSGKNIVYANKKDLLEYKKILERLINDNNKVIAEYQRIVDSLEEYK